MSGASASAAAPAGCVYRASMHRLLAYVGLQGYGTESASMPARSEEERRVIEAHLAAVEEELRIHAERNCNRKFQNDAKKKPPSVLVGVAGDVEPDDDSTIYLSLEDTPQWRAFMAGVPAAHRHTAAARRRLSLILWRSHKKGLCLYCWMPQGSCICTQLEGYRSQMPLETLTQCAPVTMLLHAEELMRSTNSGHIAAFLLDAPIRVWGVPDDDAYLRDLAPSETGAVHPATEAGTACRAVQETLNATLYPVDGALTIEAFINIHVTGGATAKDPTAADTRAATAALLSPPSSPEEVLQRPRVHLILLDSTWPQAHSLNRHIAAAVPRVALEIPASYEARFSRLRKRTRESGVSTLEATSMAVEQCLQAMGKPEEAARVVEQLMTAMESFVDLKCLLKFTDVEFTSDAEAVRALTEKRDAARREEAVKRLEMLERKIAADDRARQFLLPPVLNYCYCCDRAIGWHRMPEHVLGRGHRAALLTNPSCKPSEASSKEVVPDYSRPLRSEDQRRRAPNECSQSRGQEERG